VLIVSAFIYLTGGVASYFSPLYVLPIVAASSVQFRRGGLLVALLSTVVFLGMVVGQYYTLGDLLLNSVWHVPAIILPPPFVAQYTVALNVFVFFATALLSGSLAEELRSTGARLVRASTEIADLQALNQHVIDSLQSGLATTDPQQRVLTFNHAAEYHHRRRRRRGGRTADREVMQLPGGGDPGSRRRSGRQRRAASRAALPDGRRARRNRAGAERHASRDAGRRAGFLFSFQDVTTIKKLERDAARQQRLAAVGEMAAGIAHEIRNPLASMSGSIQILRQELPLTAEQEQLMDIVRRESERLNETIQSFLAYARPQRFAAARFDVRRALNDAARCCATAPTCTTACDRGRRAARRAVVRGRRGQIKQIVWNLASNGIRRCPRAAAAPGRRGRAGVEGRRPHRHRRGDRHRAADLDGLFQPFNGRFARGSGLGLAIVTGSSATITARSGQLAAGPGHDRLGRLPASRPLATR
jgi:two-component system sensor histidine kinase PilS (NtrC family)